ncbi:hypothetical protein SEA_ROSEPHARIE_76 [Streptomyces phage RosePharie]|nr:hypothetical protein SEA_ROSEPHARIE_76 [Streptomyces phage RosePharie]
MGLEAGIGGVSLPLRCEPLGLRKEDPVVIPDVTCTCGSDYRSHGDYVVAILFGIDIEQAHALMDATTDCLDVALDRSKDWETYKQELEDEYGRAVKARADQASS